MILALAACGRSDEEGGGESAAASQAPEVDTEAASGEISVWAMGAEGENLDVLADAYMADNPDVTVKVTAVPWDAAHDRIVNAIAVQHLHGSPAIVVDFETATAFDIIAADGAYSGTVIAPGLALAAEALFQHTSRLQRFELTKPKAVIGKDTISALLSGAVLGHVALVEGLIIRIRAELGSPAIVVATGELASLVAEQTSSIDRVEPWLAHVGLRLFYELNQGHHGHR